MTKEQKYREQMKALGIYEEIFEPEITELAQLEREKTRVQKAWSATAEEGEKPSFLDDHYAVLVNLRKEILAHREALGLTPKSLRRLRGTAEPTVREDLISAKLSAIADRVGSYSVPVFGSNTEAEAKSADEPVLYVDAAKSAESLSERNAEIVHHAIDCPPDD